MPSPLKFCWPDETAERLLILEVANEPLDIPTRPATSVDPPDKLLDELALVDCEEEKLELPKSLTDEPLMPAEPSLLLIAVMLSPPLDLSLKVLDPKLTLTSDSLDPDDENDVLPESDLLNEVLEPLLIELEII